MENTTKKQIILSKIGWYKSPNRNWSYSIWNRVQLENWVITDGWNFKTSFWGEYRRKENKLSEGFEVGQNHWAIVSKMNYKDIKDLEHVQ